MLIVLNGYPGTGKLSIGRELAEALGARLLDNHTVWNLAFALTERKTPVFYESIKAVRRLADDLICQLPDDVPIVMTEALTVGSAFCEEYWAGLEKLSMSRGPLLVVHMHCNLEENKRRMQSPERDLKRKPRDGDYAEQNHRRARALLGEDAEHFMELDVSDLAAAEAAQMIANWVDHFRAEHPEATASQSSN
ncbi:AAA family ATPase [Pseudovibrio denitrificans]|uniref:AAA family ATPase n=1 Tax=Pseudovibrio denitrificans TaxID=258256 RepID=UPI0039BFC64A